MANKKISELDNIISLDGSEVLPIVKDGVTKKVTVSQIVDNVDSYTKSESDVIFDTKVDKVTGSSLVEDTKVTAYDNHIADTSNPHNVTKAQIGLGNVDNTSDLNKPISTATQNALDTKVSNIVSVLPNGVNFDTLIDTAIYEGEITTSTGSPTGLGYFIGRVEITRTGHISNPNVIQKAYSKADGKAYVRVRQLSMWGEWSLGISQTLADKIVNTYTKSETNTILNAKEDTANKGVPNGYASLDLNGKVPLTQISDSILGQLEYMGVWDFATLPTSTQKGQYWVASGSGNGYEVGDWAVYNGTTFDKVDNTDAVSSVNGMTGNVVITKSTISLGNVDNTSDVNKPISTATQQALNNKANIATTLSGYGITDAISSNTSQTAKTVLIAPNGANGAPTFRLLQASDIPTLNQNTTGNAATATTLQTARTINGVSFNGSANITVGVSGNDITWATSPTAGKFDTSTTNPTSTNRLNFNGYLYTTALNLSTVADTTTAATHYFVETGSDGFVRPKTLANTQAEIVTFASVYNANKTWFTSGIGTAGITGATNYALFPSAQDTLTLAIGTYEIEIVAYVTVATSTVSATLQLSPRGGGTAVGTVYGMSTGAITQNGTPIQTAFGSTALGTALSITAASAVAGRTYSAQFKGIMNITTAGTIIPAYLFSATLTSGVTTLNALNHMKIKQIASTSVTTAGGWS